MKEKDFFDDKVTEAAEINIDIREVYGKKVGEIGKLFKMIFNEKPGIFKLVSNFMFYVAGRPKADSKGRLNELLEKFVTVAKWYDLAGRKGEIDRILGNHGMTLTSTNLCPPINRDSKVQKMWDALFTDPMPTTDQALLSYLLMQSEKSKQHSEILKSEVEDVSAEVETKCLINPPVFKKAAGLKAHKLEGIDISEKIQKIEDKADQMSDVLEQI